MKSPVIKGGIEDVFQQLLINRGKQISLHRQQIGTAGKIGEVAKSAWRTSLFSRQSG